MTIDCDPCRFCAHHHIDYVRIGDADYGNCVAEDVCDAELPEEEAGDGWEPGCGRPCPGFTAIPPSDWLYYGLC